nr:hypothetical protein [Tanacetum cinerariifolium]
MLITCNECEGMLRGGFCLPCNLKENSFICYQNAYSFNDTSNNSNHLPQPQYENYLCNLCGNNSHDGYDCQQQFPLVYEQEPSYNQNYDDNYYPHESPSFPCYDNCIGSHETFQCQPMDQNVYFFDHLENSSNEIASSSSNQEKEGPPQDFDIRQLIREECCIEGSKEQKQNMEETILELSGIEELVPILSENEVTSEDESKCDMLIQDQSSSVFTTFSNPLFKDNDDLTSSDDESLFEEDVPIEESKVYSNPLFDNDEINSDELESHVESNFVESLSNQDALIDSNADTIVEFIPSLPILIQDGDSQREEIKIVTETNDVLPPSVENDDDSEEEIHFLEELLNDNSIP